MKKQMKIIKQNTLIIQLINNEKSPITSTFLLTKIKVQIRTTQKLLDQSSTFNYTQ